MKLLKIFTNLIFLLLFLCIAFPHTSQASGLLPVNMVQPQVGKKLTLDPASVVMEATQTSGDITFKWTINPRNGTSIATDKVIMIGASKGTADYFGTMLKENEIKVPASTNPPEGFRGIPLKGQDVWVRVYILVTTNGVSNFEYYDFKYPGKELLLGSQTWVYSNQGVNFRRPQCPYGYAMTGLNLYCSSDCGERDEDWVRAINCAQITIQ